MSSASSLATTSFNVLGSTFFKLSPIWEKKCWVLLAYSGNSLTISATLLTTTGTVKNIKEAIKNIKTP